MQASLKEGWQIPSNVMTMLRKVLDFVYFLPFLFSLYHHPESSGMFYDSPYFSCGDIGSSMD